MSEEKKDEGKEQEGKEQEGKEQEGKEQGQQQTPGPVPYDRFKEINEALKAANDQLAALEKTRGEAEEADLKKQEKWKELAEKREAELAVERAKLLRLKVAGEKGIPLAMADRLRGATEEEMIKDAETLLPLLKPAEGPGIPPVKKGGEAQKFDLESMSPEEIRKNRDAIMKQEAGG